MEYVVGFLIALFIALTGVGAGTITVPILVLFLNVPAAIAVSIGLMFSAAVKLILLPVHVVRGTISWRTLGWMLLGGIPGVLIGSLLLRQLVNAGSQSVLNALLGLILISTAGWQLFFYFRPGKERSGRPDKTKTLPWLMFPVGAEVGFSSAGAGALGSAALLSFTSLAPPVVIGTDIAFGFTMSLIGSGAHLLAHGSDMGLLLHLITGGAFGAIAGTLLSGLVPHRPLRVALWMWLLLLGGQFLSNSYTAQTVHARQHEPSALPQHSR